MSWGAVGYNYSEGEGGHRSKSDSLAQQRKPTLHCGLTKHLAFPASPPSSAGTAVFPLSLGAHTCPIFAMQALRYPAIPWQEGWSLLEALSGQAGCGVLSISILGSRTETGCRSWRWGPSPSMATGVGAARMVSGNGVIAEISFSISTRD